MEMKIRGIGKTAPLRWETYGGSFRVIQQSKRVLTLSFCKILQPSIKDKWMSLNRYTYMIENKQTVTRYPILKVNVVANINKTIRRLNPKKDKTIIGQLSELREYFKSRIQVGKAETKRIQNISLVFDEAYLQNRKLRSESAKTIKELTDQNRRLALIQSFKKTQKDKDAIQIVLENNNGSLLREKNHLKTLNAKRKEILKGYQQ
jgi:hypothetical protein